MEEKKAIPEKDTSTAEYKMRNRTGKVLFNSTNFQNTDDFALKLIEAEQYLNTTIAIDLAQRFKIGFRFHL